MCITPDDDRPGSPNTSEFDALFGGIARRNVNGFCCYEGGEAWNFGALDSDGDGVSVIDSWEEHVLGLIVPGSQFMELLPEVFGFWTDYWFFPVRPASTLQLRCVTHNAQCLIADTYPHDASHMISNVDAAYWVLLTEQIEDIIEVEQRWHRTSRVDVTVQ